jgi:hypothetical protein
MADETFGTETSKKKSTIEDIADHIPSWVPGASAAKATVKKAMDVLDKPKETLDYITKKSEPGSAPKILDESKKRIEGTSKRKTKKDSPLGDYE